MRRTAICIELPVPHCYMMDVTAVDVETIIVVTVLHQLSCLAKTASATRTVVR